MVLPCQISASPLSIEWVVSYASTAKGLMAVNPVTGESYFVGSCTSTPQIGDIALNCGVSTLLPTDLCLSTRVLMDARSTNLAIIRCP
jgi:hypothetical protein